MFLTDTELLELTGYQIFAWQARWLERHRWKFERSRTGRPVVSRAYAEFRLSDGQQEEPTRVSLNLDAIRKRA